MKATSTSTPWPSTPVTPPIPPPTPPAPPPSAAGTNRRLAVLETRQILNEAAGHGNRTWYIFAGTTPTDTLVGEEHNLHHDGCINLTPMTAKEALDGEYFAILMPNDEIGLACKGPEAFHQMADSIHDGPLHRGKPVRFNLDYADTPVAA